MRISAELAIVCVILAGCQRNPFADQYTTSRPREEDLIGQYVFSRDTVTWGKSAAIKTVALNCVPIRRSSRPMFRVPNSPVVATIILEISSMRPEHGESTALEAARI